MRSLSHLPRRHWFAAFAVFTILLFASGSAIEVIGGVESRVGSGRLSSSVASERVLPKRRLAGSGSSPPTCISKCESCLPCKPVLVSEPPAQNSAPDDYKPQVWRCTCGGKIYIP